MKVNEKLIKEVLNNMNFDKIMEIYNVFRDKDGILHPLNEVAISGTYFDPEHPRIITPESLREDAESLLRTLFDDSLFPKEEHPVERNMCHGAFCAEVYDTHSNKNGTKITAIGLSFIPLNSSAWI